MQPFTTGAFLAPLKLPDGKFVWQVVQFEDDTFLNGECIDPDTISETEKGLINRLDPKV